MFRKLRRYSADKEGMAAVEFAFVLPILLIMLLSMVELTQAMLARSDVTNMASTAANLVAEDKTLTNTDLTNIFNAIGAMLFPFNLSDSSQSPPNLYSITVTSVIDGGAGNSPVVAWSCTQNGTKEIKGLPPSVPLPDNTITANGTSVIWARVTYTYISPLNYLLTASNRHPWINDFYVKPRRALQIPTDTTDPPSATICNK